MEFIDLKSQYAALKTRIDARVAAVLDHGGYIMGPEVAEFEAALADYCGVRHVISCANGTDALVLALKALDIGAGDVVLTTPFTFFATAEAIMIAGARPVFVDIDPVTFNLDPDCLDAAAAREPSAKAVMTVDLFGLPANYSSIEAICAARGLELIEDAAQGFGGRIGTRRACSFGDIATTSFFPAKPLGCYGDGGALMTGDDALAATLRSLRIHGKGSHKYDNVRIGTNSRLDTLQAAILIEKLAEFPHELTLRQAVASRYADALHDVVACPQVPQGYVSSWAQYSVLAPDEAHRDQITAMLGAAGIPTAIYYPRPLHLQPALASLGHGHGDFPIAEDVAGRVFSLPMGPYLSEADQARVIEVMLSLDVPLADAA